MCSSSNSAASLLWNFVSVLSAYGLNKVVTMLEERSLAVAACRTSVGYWRPETYVLAAISGPSSLSLYTDSGHVFWKYDASPEFISCIRCNPFDSRHFCVLGLKGFLLSVKLVGITENDVALKEFHIQTDCSDLHKLEREVVVSSSHSTFPSSTVFPFYSAKFSFSPHWKHILFVTFPRELVVFDLQYEASLYVVALPRDCAKFVDVLPDPSQNNLYCLHLDGKLSIWRRKE